MNDGLTGTVPTELNELTKLQDLHLSGTAITGSIYRLFRLRGVIELYYTDGSYVFVEDTDQYDALELLANSDPVLVPIPDDSDDSKYLLLQQYAMMVLYLATTGNEGWSRGKWLEDQAGSQTCSWFGVTCPYGRSIDSLTRTYNSVKTEPAICKMISSLTAVLFSKSGPEQPFRKPSYGNWISDDTPKVEFV
jgi:hypothetical protein